MVELSTSWFGLVVPSFVGGILALVLYTLFLSNIVSGQLFPTFDTDTGTKVPQSFDMLKTQHAHSVQDYGKLLFWRFVAGFNQRYAVDIIRSVHAKP